MERGNSKLRFLDENVGPFVLFILGFFRKTWRAILQAAPPAQDEIKSIAILKLAAIGDTVLLSGLVNDLHLWKPGLRIVLFVGGSNASYARMLPLIDEVVVLPVSDPLTSLSLLRQERFDLLLNADSWPRLSAILGACAKAKWVVGFLTPGESRHFADDQLVPHRADLHEIENYRGLLRALRIPAGEAPLKPQHAPMKDVPNAIVLHPWPGGTKSHLREWHMDRWIRLMVLLSERGPYTFYLTGSPDQAVRNQLILDQLPRELRARVKSVAGSSLQQTVDLLAAAKLLVSVDTGIMHIGAALGIPVVSLHGPSNPGRWGPVGPEVYPVASRMPGAGKLILGFEYTSDINFMDGISVQEVYATCERALGLTDGRSTADM